MKRHTAAAEQQQQQRSGERLDTQQGPNGLEEISGAPARPEALTAGQHTGELSGNMASFENVFIG